MSTSLKSSVLSAVLAATVVFAATATALANDDENGGHHRNHGHFGGAAMKVCKGQSNEADKKACFKQLWKQRKAAIESFEKSFTYTPASGASGASGD